MLTNPNQPLALFFLFLSLSNTLESGILHSFTLGLSQLCAVITWGSEAQFAAFSIVNSSAFLD